MAGSSIFYPMEAGLKSLTLGSESFSRLSQQGLWFGVAGLYHEGPLLVSGVRISQKRNGLKFWEPREINYFTHLMSVKKQPLTQARVLRLPAQVVEKIKNQSDQVRNAQARQVADIFLTPEAPWSFWCPEQPIHSAITSHFASPRTLPSGRSYYHSGVDLRAASGYPIKAISSGKVRFAGPMIVPGNNVILDHGQGLFSRYMHLSKIKVDVGSWIKKGEIIGLAGASGRVQASHLHWEMVWNGAYADPLALVEAWKPLCQIGDISDSQI